MTVDLITAIETIELGIFLLDQLLQACNPGKPSGEDWFNQQSESVPEAQMLLDGIRVQRALICLREALCCLQYHTDHVL